MSMSARCVRNKRENARIWTEGTDTAQEEKVRILLRNRRVSRTNTDNKSEGPQDNCQELKVIMYNDIRSKIRKGSLSGEGQWGKN